MMKKDYDILIVDRKDGKPAMLKATMSEIRICDENNRLLTTHSRSYKDFPRYITKEEHVPPEHQYYRELNAHDGAYYRRWAATYGDAMAIMIDRVLRSAKHEERAHNSCKGILHMCRDIPRHILEKQYRHVSTHLSAGIPTSRRRSA